MIDILIVLFCGTRIGRVILGLLIVYFFVALMGWAIVPFLAIIIGGLCIHASISGIEYCEKGVKMRKTPLIVGSFFLVFALLFIIGSRSDWRGKRIIIMYHRRRKRQSMTIRMCQIA